MAKRIFGEISGVSEGQLFESRKALHDSGVHLPLVAGISGSQLDGADSIVISGGYEDDTDFGDEIIYTGHGGQDEKGRQISDQTLTVGNMGLAISENEGLPVRVIRGAHKGNQYAPEKGYRYDGLYLVDSHWHETGKSGYKVWRFKLLKVRGSVTPKAQSAPVQLPLGSASPKRVNLQVQRIVRDSRLGKKVKGLYEYKCQVCGIQIKTDAGFYAEAAHIKPVGKPHDGPDTADNLLCLCPNHHLMFDKGVFAINNNYELIGLPGSIYMHSDHKICLEYLDYHRITITNY